MIVFVVGINLHELSCGIVIHISFISACILNISSLFACVIILDVAVVAILIDL